MTKYLLNSGGIRNNPRRGDEFFREMVKDLGPSPRLLLVHFAQPRETWEIKYPEYVERIKAAMPPGVQPSFELAMPETFVEQVAASDALYLHGGDDHLIQYWLRKFSVPSIWEGKVVATNSASSHALVQHFWTCDHRQCMDGLGIIPIKFLAHFQSTYGNDDPRGPIDWAKAKGELSQCGDTTLPVYALHEGDYRVFKL